MHTTKVAFMLLCCVKTINDVFQSFKQGLGELYNTNEKEALTLWVVSEIMELSKATIKAFPEKELTVLQQELTSSILMELKTGKPLQYILGYAEFYGSRFVVNPAVLIPRPETEELVEWALVSWQLAVSSWQKPYKILDIGTGSGCIAISLKKSLPDVNVYAIDISLEAIQVAKTNALLNAVEVDFIETDILTHNSKLKTPYSLIISNPPYVTPADKEQMHLNVVDFEPHTALFVPQDDPLLFYRAIARFAADNLDTGGLLFFEINESYGEDTVDLLKSLNFKNIELRKDMSDRYRMIKANI
jgi:release factor glutamine methyltransferase